MITLTPGSERDSICSIPLPSVKNLSIHAFSKPTRYVGGDFYDFIELDNGELFGVIADVSGKGVSAALLMSAPSLAQPTSQNEKPPTFAAPNKLQPKPAAAAGRRWGLSRAWSRGS